MTLKSSYFFDFLTLTLCLQHFDNNFPLNQEARLILSHVLNTLGTTVGLRMCFSVVTISLRLWVFRTGTP